MTENNNWPGKPGVPLNPEKDGYHRLKSRGGDKDFILEWSASNGWITMLRWSINTIVEFMAYVGPVLTLAEEEALQARVAELEGALRPFAELGRFVVEHHPDPETDLNHEMSALVRHFRNAYAALEGKKELPTMTEEQLREMMRDPRYWRQRNPEWVKRVTDGFRALVGGKKDEA